MKNTENQKQFVRDAESQGFDVDFEYSGRGMFGETCPAIRVSDLLNDFKTSAMVKYDNMGREFVIYAQA